MQQDELIRMERDLKILTIGFIAGVLVGVFTAPSKGRITRKKLKYQADLLKDQMGEALDEAKEEVKRVKKAAVS